MDENTKMHETMISLVSTQKKLNLRELEHSFSLPMKTEHVELAKHSEHTEHKDGELKSNLLVVSNPQTQDIEAQAPDFVLRYLELRDKIACSRKEMDGIQPHVLSWLQERDSKRFTLCNSNREQNMVIRYYTGMRSSSVTQTYLEEGLGNFIREEKYFEHLSGVEKCELVKKMTGFLWNSRRKKTFQEVRFEQSKRGTKRLRAEEEEEEVVDEDAFI